MSESIAIQFMYYCRCQKLQPLLIKFNTDLEMEEWQADLVNGEKLTLLNHPYFHLPKAKVPSVTPVYVHAGMNSIRGITTAPTFPGCLFSVTARGEVMVFDPKVALDNAEQVLLKAYNCNCL